MQAVTKAICNWCIVFVSCQFFFKKSSVFAIHTNTSSQCFFKFIHSGAHFQHVLLLATENAISVWMDSQSSEKKSCKRFYIYLYNAWPVLEQQLSYHIDVANNKKRN